MSGADNDIGPLPPGLAISEKALPATQYRQGERTQYDVVLPVAQIVETLNRPDHTHPINKNRKIDFAHAKAFALYLLRNDEFGCPSIMVRVQPGILRFEARQVFEGLSTAWGYIYFRPGDVVLFLILDGQHRVLGCYIAVETVRNRIVELETQLDKAKGAGEPNLISRTQAELRIEQAKFHRLMTQSITLQLVETNEEAGTRLFVDINDNVKGVRTDFRTFLDDRSPIGLITGDLVDTHPLLVGRVESGQERGFGRGSKMLIGAKGVSDIARAVLLGTVGRVGVRVEDELKAQQTEKIAEVKKFLDLLVNYTDLRQVADNELEPPDLRYDKDVVKPHATMLASTTILRVLAGVYHDLTATEPKTGKAYDGGTPMTRTEVGMFFRSLTPLLRDVPVVQGSPWYSTGLFVDGGSAPTGRHGDMRKLTELLCSWARSGLPTTTPETADEPAPPSEFSG